MHIMMSRSRATLFALLAAGVMASRAADAQHSRLRTIDRATMRDTVERLATDMLVPGAAVIVLTPKGDFRAAYGVSAYRGKAPTSLEQHMRVGSITKTWTGTVILQLVQEGKVKLDDPVSTYRPDVPNGAHITIEQLLTMRSGGVTTLNRGS